MTHNIMTAIPLRSMAAGELGRWHNVSLKNIIGGKKLKALRIIMVSVILVLSLLISVGISSVEASDYLGELCWSVHTTEVEDGPEPGNAPGLLRMGVTHTGGPYYLLQGTQEVSNDNTMILSGTAVIIGNDVLATIDSSKVDGEERQTGIVQMRFSLSTFNGTYWANGLEFDTSSHKFDHNYSAGTVTAIPCP